MRKVKLKKAIEEEKASCVASENGWAAHLRMQLRQEAQVALKAGWRNLAIAKLCEARRLEQQYALLQKYGVLRSDW